MQQMGLFDVSHSSECNTPKEDFGGTTLTNFLAQGAAICCNSKRVDQAVCQVDQCTSGMLFCFASHADDLEDSAKKITNPNAIETNEQGNPQGDCGLALLFDVEGEVCCSAMKQLTTCISREVGDYTRCKETWNSMFDPNFFYKTFAAVRAFEAGGYCVSLQASTTQKQPETRMINSKPCLVENIVVLATQDCVKGPPDYDFEGMVCANDGELDEAYCSFEVGDAACAYCKSVCPKCGLNKKTGKLSCCTKGGAWYKNCGNGPDAEHSWEEGIMACNRKCDHC